MTQVTDTPQTSAESDLAYLKRMASAGRGAPAPFLLLMAVFGGAYGLFATVVSIMAFVEMSDGLPPVSRNTPIALVSGWGFVLAHVAFVAAAVWTLWRTFGPRRVAVSRTAWAIWSAALIGLIASLGAVTSSELGHHPMLGAEGLPSALLIMWGSAWWATAIVGDRKWLFAIAAGSFVAAIALPTVVGSLWALPLLAACLLGLAFLPAVLLMRERRA